MRAAAEHLWLLQVPVRPGRAQPPARRAVAGGRPAIFQRVWRGRGAQGPHGVDRLAAIRAIPSRGHRQAVRRARRPCTGLPEPRLCLDRGCGQGEPVLPRSSAQVGHFQCGVRPRALVHDVATVVVNTLRAAEGKPPLALEELVQEGLLEYIRFPDALRGRYQSFTQSEVSRLRTAGYATPLFPWRKASRATASGCSSVVIERRRRLRVRKHLRAIRVNVCCSVRRRTLPLLS